MPPSIETSPVNARDVSAGTISQSQLDRPMSAGPHDRRDEDFAVRFEEYRPKVKAFLHNRAPWLDSDARDELYQQGWLAILEARKAGRRIDNELGYLFGTTSKLAGSMVGSADARRRTTFDPISGNLAELPHDAPDVAEVVAVLDEAAVGRSLLDRLSPRQRLVAIRRYGRGDTPAEICADLNMSRRRYEKTIDKITQRLGVIVADYHAGRLAASDRKLLARCVLGEADTHDREVATRLVESAQGRALLCSVRHAFRDAAMTSPLPVVTSPGVSEQLGSYVEHTKATVTGLVGRGSASTTETVTSLVSSGTGRGSGAFAAQFVACVICAGGAGAGALAATGTSPNEVKDAIVQNEDPSSEPQTRAPAETPVTETVATPPPTPSTTTTPAPAPLNEPPGATTVPREEPQPVAPSAPPEFGFEQHQSTTPAAPATPATTEERSSRDFAAPAPPSGGSGGGRRPEFGFEGG